MMISSYLHLLKLLEQHFSPTVGLIVFHKWEGAKNEEISLVKGLNI